jgi:hypothetical protein
MLPSSHVIQYLPTMRTASLVVSFVFLVHTILAVPALELQVTLGEINTYSNWPLDGTSGEFAEETIAKNAHANQWVDDGRDFIRQSDIVCMSTTPFLSSGCCPHRCQMSWFPTR